ncbi:MAG: structural protein [Alphaproteobacteria bacterium]
MTTPRGLRNHNPGNLRHSSDRWRGMARDQTDNDFVAFEHPVYGIRALARTLLTYQEKYGLRTLRQMVERWAPPVENDTQAYIAHLAALTGVAPDAPIALRDRPQEFGLMVLGIIRHENGAVPYEKALIDDGILLACAA